MAVIRENNLGMSVAKVHVTDFLDGERRLGMPCFLRGILIQFSFLVISNSTIAEKRARYTAPFADARGPASTGVFAEVLFRKERCDLITAGACVLVSGVAVALVLSRGCGGGGGGFFFCDESLIQRFPWVIYRDRVTASVPREWSIFVLIFTAVVYNFTSNSRELDIERRLFTGSRSLRRERGRAIVTVTADRSQEDVYRNPRTLR